MITCTDCGNELPPTKFNAESYSPTVCFKCRVSGIRLGFRAGKETFHGDNLYGGTIRSDVEHTLSEARSNGHDPVPVSSGVSHGPSTTAQMNRLKSAVSAT